MMGEGGKVVSQVDDRGDRKKYRIDIGAYGSIGIEAPTKKECLELFMDVTKTKRDSKIDEAIR
jgi:hypothetical protein